MLRLLLVISMLALSGLRTEAQPAETFAEKWERSHISRMPPSDVRHIDLKKYLDHLKKLGVRVDQLGFSNAGREIFQAEWGHGPLRILMWSQMHGDEPTATSALIDMLAILQKNRDKDWIRKLREAITIRAVPMLNPDGAELYQRRNLQGIDINRDALDLKTPEARLLKQLRDDWNPAVGFNLHNQNALTTVGRSYNQAAISLLVVYGDEAKTPSPGHERNGRVAAAIVLALQKYIPGHIARYSDEWTPTAFGDNFSAWGTPVILIETGALDGKDEMLLVKMNVIAFLTALQSLATGSYANQDPAAYANLPENSSGTLVDIVFRNASLVETDSLGSTSARLVDISAVSQRRRASFAPLTVIREIGDLGAIRGLKEYDANGFNVVQRLAKTKPGELAELLFYRTGRSIDWNSAALEKQFPPDAIFSGGKWILGDKMIQKRQ